MTARPGEDELIARYFAPLAGDPGAFGLGDDAACIAVPAGQELVVTADALVAGVHFFADDPADLIARKALRTNLSDLAAKGAFPRGYLLTLALPDDWSEEWLARFAEGLEADQKQYGVSLLGGDTTRANGPLMLSITALGLVPASRMVRRSGARPGDRLFVTGSIGDAALGCRLRLEPQAFTDCAARDRAYLDQRYLLPEPRNALAATLSDHASAAMDISDGLAGDCAKLCRASGLSADIAVERIPLSPAAASLCEGRPDRLLLALSGGDDYEILFSVPPERCDDVMAGARAAGVDVHDIGVMVPGDQLPRFLQGKTALEFRKPSFSHF